MSVVVVVPVYRNAATLRELHDRLAAALTDEDWVLRLVDDACPSGSGQTADELARRAPQVRVTHLVTNVGQHGALVAGLLAEPEGSEWVLLDADLQDPPEAVPTLLAELRAGAGRGVFAGRRGTYGTAGRRLTGRVHRRLLRALTGLPADAGGFLVMDAELRRRVLDLWVRTGAPSVVAAVGLADVPLSSVPVTRARRVEGTSAWTSRARLEQGMRTLTWALRMRATRRPAGSSGQASALLQQLR